MFLIKIFYERAERLCISLFLMRYILCLIRLVHCGFKFSYLYFDKIAPLLNQWAILHYRPNFNPDKINKIFYHCILKLVELPSLVAKCCKLRKI